MTLTKTYTPAAKNFSAVKFNAGEAKEMMRSLCGGNGDRGKKGAIVRVSLGKGRSRWVYNYRLILSSTKKHVLEN